MLTGPFGKMGLCAHHAGLWRDIDKLQGPVFAGIRSTCQANNKQQLDHHMIPWLTLPQAKTQLLRLGLGRSKHHQLVNNLL